MNFFQYLFDSTYSGTIWLYNLIFALTSIFAFLAQRRFCDYPNKKNLWFVASFIFAWFFFAFNNTGTDLAIYIQQYKEAILSAQFITGAGLESGYRLIIALMHSVIDDPYLGIGIIKTVQLLLIYYCIYKLKDKISVGYAVMAYMAIFYFASFNILRISLAGSLVLLSYVFLLNRKRFQSYVLVAIAITIHKSATIYALALVSYLCFLAFKKMKSLIRFAVLLAVPIIVLLGRNIILSFLQTGFFMERYSSYLTSESTFGIAQVVFYLPVFFVLYQFANKREELDNNYFDVNFNFAITGFAVALLGYSVGILARVSIMFSGPFVFLLPQYINQRTKANRFPHKVALISIVMVMYWIIRYVLSMGGYFLTSGLYPFQLIF